MLFSVETDTGTYIVQEPCGQGLTKAEGFPWGDIFVPALTFFFFLSFFFFFFFFRIETDTGIYMVFLGEILLCQL